MKKKRLIYILVLSILVGSFGSAFFFVISVIASGPDTVTTPEKEKYTQGTIVHLYFANKENSFLMAEKRVLVQSDNPAQRGKLIIESLIKGPKEGLMRTIPLGSTLRTFFVTKDKTAYADFSPIISEKHPGGCKAEIITIYSIVNSLILNVPEIDTVKILIGGREALTLAGHIDLRFPLKADMLLVR
ncbi:MAG: GerMN domain-containing protein [Thermodesulfobacteriota bacterium]|nr:GerMN domain-containing protein [Thermodesulfobacteriota bacterium]